VEAAWVKGVCTLSIHSVRMPARSRRSTVDFLPRLDACISSSSCSGSIPDTIVWRLGRGEREWWRLGRRCCRHNLTTQPELTTLQTGERSTWDWCEEPRAVAPTPTWVLTGFQPLRV
jgi:hypothetical protein